MSEKTIAEQFEDEYNPITTCMSSVKNAIERIERRLSALEKPRAEKPHAREWMTGDTPIWMAFIPYGKTNWAVRRGILAEVAANDLWMPYDPEHPEPPASPEKI